MIKKLSPDEIKHISQLCNIELTPEQVSMLEHLFTDTLEHISVINELDTSKVTATAQGTTLKNVFQNGNQNTATLTVDEALSNAKQVMDNKFVTKAVFDRE